MGRKLTIVHFDNETEPLFEMSRITASRVKIEDIDFVFYYSTKDEMKHAIRVKIAWNPSRMTETNTLELHGDYGYNTKNPSEQDNVSAKQLNKARKFFKKYKVLLAAVWEKVLDPYDFTSYFYQDVSFKTLLSKFALEEDELSLIEKATDVAELEAIVREYNIFNMND